ncbi:outer membrane porin HofQ [Salmonella enterica]|nr:outer membrane porin HofQ [Salmonella enterica subsp. enterica serovar Enteritidis str. 58-6482]SUF84613.1 outer membrane porin HofQ [Salmonella enterica]SUG81207.1 outer membrane porin HofQ [Salmonella enterica subsp. enterica]
MPAAQAGKAAKVTLVVDDVPVVQVLQTLAEQERQNLVVSPDVSGTLSLHLTDVPWKQALQTVVNSAGLVLRQEGNILHVHSQAWQKEHSARQDAERLRLQANLPLENRSISLQYADAAELAKAGEKLLSAKGTIMVDKRTNRMLLRDNRAALAELEKWVSQMDLPVAQVELAAHIVTINEKSLRELGVKWTLADATQRRFPVIYLSPPPPHASGLTSGALTDACWIWSCQRWSKSSSWILSPAPGCWLPICSQPVSSKAAKFLIRFPAAKAARPPWNLKKRCWGWR